MALVFTSLAINEPLNGNKQVLRALAFNVPARENATAFATVPVIQLDVSGAAVLVNVACAAVVASVAPPNQKLHLTAAASREIGLQSLTSRRSR